MSSTPALPEGLRVALTGGTSGLGLSLVGQLHQAGARVAFVARGRDRVEAVQRRYPGSHGIVGDISSKDAIYPSLRFLASRRSRHLVNNASDSASAGALGDTDARISSALATNLVGPFRLTRPSLARSPARR
jgi:NAD(P)-dependent dehydrogenase (short-subunit alcohol dehydrogenase family)